MKRYELTDQVVFYFITEETDGGSSIVRGFTDDKSLAKFYMEFHNCPKLRMKTVENTMENVVKLVNNNANDEIHMFNISTRNRSRDSDDLIKIISIPATEPEIIHVHDMSNTSCSAMVNYTELNDIFPSLKAKYQQALGTLGLVDVIKKEIHNQPSKFTSGIAMDELMILLKFFPDMFG